MRLLAAAMISAIALSGCGEKSSPDSVADLEGSADPGLVHIHGLGVNPSDDALFLATHTGVWRLPEGSDNATRVANNFQDTMGFAVVGPNRFIGSGHPDFTEKLPPYLGFIESTDAARTWKKISLLGEADFHVLEGSGRQMYGFGSDFKTRSQQLLVSDDSGRSWTSRDFPEPFASLAIDPSNPKTAIASGEQKLHLTTNGGRSWKRTGGTPGYLAWTNAGVFRIDGSGSVAKTSGPGSKWSEIGAVGGTPVAFDSHEDALLVALEDSTVKRSSDGEAWTVRYRP